MTPIKQWLCGAAILTVVVTGCSRARRPDVGVLVGTYSTISESEWETSVELRADGAAIIRNESWSPGEASQATTDVTKARWVLDGQSVRITYGNDIERFEYTEHLSLDEIGKEGSAPGIVAVEPAAKGAKIGHYSLWKRPFKF